MYHCVSIMVCCGVQSSLIRHAEFCRACVKRVLDGQTQPQMVYYGVMREEHKRVMSDIEADVFQYWDNLSTSPAKTRPRPTSAEVRVEGLSICSYTAAGAVWPEHLLEKFPRDSAHHKELLDLKAKFIAEFPAAADSPSRASAGAPSTALPRAVGRPDFQESAPLDIQRLIDVELAAPPPPAERIASKEKPFLLKIVNYNIYIYMYININIYFLIVHIYIYIS